MLGSVVRSYMRKWGTFDKWRRMGLDGVYVQKRREGNGYEGRDPFFSINFLFSFLSCSSFPFLSELSICPIDLFILWDIILFCNGSTGFFFSFSPSFTP